jgi:arylsulfatase A-like enzyme
VSGFAPSRAQLQGWLCLALLCWLAPACGKPKTRPGVQPRNVLLITASSLRRDHLSCYMYARPTSAWPATEEERSQGRALSLDDIAEQGVVLASAFSNSPRIFPALCALQTGTWNPSDGDPALDVALEQQAVTVAERFRAAGFATAAFVGGLGLREARGVDQGFELWESRYADAAILDMAREWLQDPARDAQRPWLVWVHLAGCDPPHDPRGQAPLPGDVPGVLDFSRRYADPSYQGPADGSMGYLAQLESGATVAGAQDRARMVDLYDGEVARVASGVRQLVLALRNLDENGNAWANTLFAFCGLQGIELGDSGPRAWGADALNAQTLGVPLILRHKASLTGSRVLAEPVGLEDVGPTLCAFFGLEAPGERAQGRPGRSLLPVLDSYAKLPFEHRPAFAVWNAASAARSLRTREHAAVETTFDGATRLAVFDRIVDRGERHDLALEQPELRAALAAALEQAASEFTARSP